MQHPALLLIAVASLTVASSGCTLVSDTLLVTNKPHLVNPEVQPVPEHMRGNPVVTTPASMKNRFSYYGLDHAE